MIAIVNIDETDKIYGEQLYSVRINREELFQFKHIREQPISKCLEQAMLGALVYEQKKEDEIFDQLNVHRQDW